MRTKTKPTSAAPSARNDLTRRRQTQLEHMVLDAVRTFERVTGCTVGKIQLQRRLRFGQAREEIVGVDAEVNG